MLRACKGPSAAGGGDAPGGPEGRFSALESVERGGGDSSMSYTQTGPTAAGGQALLRPSMLSRRLLDARFWRGVWGGAAAPTTASKSDRFGIPYTTAKAAATRPPPRAASFRTAAGSASHITKHAK